MKQVRIYILAVAVIALLVSLSVAGDKEEKTERGADGVLSVQMLAKSPQKFLGQDLTVAGVVGNVTEHKNVFTLIDKAACGGCPSKRSCGVTEFKVSYKGDPPKKRKQVKVTGRLVEVDKGRYLLEASRIQ
jgi:hypothetical protein